jgi:lipoprotein-anchoring transpeptidase ErfK/SrfK
MNPLRLAALLAGVLLVPTAFAPGAQAEEIVRFSDPGYSAGTIVVKTAERRLYFVLPGGRALRYAVGVGKPGKQWAGRTRIVAKVMKPAWSPPAEVKRDIPGLPAVIAGGAANNPMGAAALVLAAGEYAIHGTNRPKSVGGFVSYGCIRMLNTDVLSLYQRVRIGTQVVVLR